MVWAHQRRTIVQAGDGQDVRRNAGGDAQLGVRRVQALALVVVPGDHGAEGLVDLCHGTVRFDVTIVAGHAEDVEALRGQPRFHRLHLGVGRRKACIEGGGGEVLAVASALRVGHGRREGLRALRQRQADLECTNRARRFGTDGPIRCGPTRLGAGQAVRSSGRRRRGRHARHGDETNPRRHQQSRSDALTDCSEHLMASLRLSADPFAG